jgi:hypothetical protein
VLKSVSVSEVRARRRPKPHYVIISAVGTEVLKAVRGVRRGSHKRANREGLRFDMGEDIKGMGRDDVGKGGDYGDAVPGIGGFKERVRIGRGRGRKSRGRFRT